MAAWLSANIGTIIVILVLAAVIALAVRSMIKDKKSGKGGYGCGCANCAMHGKCHAVKTIQSDLPGRTRPSLEQDHT